MSRCFVLWNEALRNWYGTTGPFRYPPSIVATTWLNNHIFKSRSPEYSLTMSDKHLAYCARMLPGRQHVLIPPTRDISVLVEHSVGKSLLATINRGDQQIVFDISEPVRFQHKLISHVKCQ